MKVRLTTLAFSAATAFFAQVAMAEDGDSYALRQAIGQSAEGIQGEVLKSAAADKTVQEGIAAFKAQMTLQSRAVDLQQTMQQPDHMCMDMGSQDVLARGAQLTRVGVTNSQRSLMSSSMQSSSPAAALDTAYRATNSKFCSESEVALGVCKASADSKYTNLAGADQNAMYLFQSHEGGDTYEGVRNGSQIEAVNSYISRVVTGAVKPAQLRTNKKTDYQNNPQARAYMEMLRRYNGFLSMASYSLNSIKEMRNPAQ